MAYCGSRFHTVRRVTREVMVGGVGVGGSNPVRIQSMTTSDTQDVEATVRQSIALAEVGCEIVRVTAPNVAASKCLKDIRKGLSDAGWAAIPLVADIHFLPQAAMEAVEHVEKVRVNPGNYADKKKFAVRDYSDADYDLELQRIYETFSPLVVRSKELGRSMRIGTNHGSLSDRIMNRYGDTPLGMVESALEFLRIAESHSFRDIILSMKSSNPKVMIEAYRLLVERMDAEDMHYPLHLGVTEAGDGEDGRIKGSIGIGSLLLDGLGDTIRVSLTEDSVYEIPVARAIADKAMGLWGLATEDGSTSDSIDPFHFERRATSALLVGPSRVGPEQPPRVIVRAASAAQASATLSALSSPLLKDTPAEGLLVPIAAADELGVLEAASKTATSLFLVLELVSGLVPGDLEAFLSSARPRVVLLRRFGAQDSEVLSQWCDLAKRTGHFVAIDASPADFSLLSGAIKAAGDSHLIVTHSGETGRGSDHPVGAYRRIVEILKAVGSRAPVWIRNTSANTIHGDNSFLSKLIEASFLTGSLLCDGVGDLVSIETESDAPRSARLSYNVLQGAGARISKAEFVACPSCGRTLFDLQTTTQRIRSQTAHLKGVKIAIMGCIVNGPGEMADADFGYVGGAPGKINLYVGKQCVQYNIPQAEADARLIALIKEHKKWAEPEPAHA
ncbi:MAG TPA: (E)-4-hydroxy-3-methylbut-2-enyl-diphosphate synthase [Opitutaceae bacterium]|jgi:(E)-4-hydroxy-3-methylbut-2-enyl-diphosphate synthase|nr:(E)-4-hydroxy-3-methylbut-2-enyl-diphosphate synthase [Opitutaceae bacterium]